MHLNVIPCKQWKQNFLKLIHRLLSIQLFSLSILSYCNMIHRIVIVVCWCHSICANLGTFPTIPAHTISPVQKKIAHFTTHLHQRYNNNTQKLG